MLEEYRSLRWLLLLIVKGKSMLFPGVNIVDQLVEPGWAVSRLLVSLPLLAILSVHVVLPVCVVILELGQLVLCQEAYQKGLGDVGVDVRAVAGDVEADEELTQKKVGGNFSLNQVVPSYPVDHHH
jgi:hypothetical protein